MINECTECILINRPTISEMTLHTNVDNAISMSGFRFPLLTCSIRVIRLANKPSQLTVLVIRKKENLIIEKIPRNRIRFVKGSSCFIRIFLEFTRSTMKTFLKKLSTGVCKYRLLNLQPVNFTVGFFPGIFRHCLDLLVYRTLEEFLIFEVF